MSDYDEIAEVFKPEDGLTVSLRGLQGFGFRFSV